MGKRKPKEPESTLNKAAAPAQSDIFKTLFGDAPAQNTVVSSLFSDDNPFRRKLKDSSSIESPKSLDSVDADIAELKKRRKRNKEKKSNLDSDSVAKNEEDATETPLLTKKSKKEKNLGSDTDGASKEDGEGNPNMGPESNGESKKYKGKISISDFDANGEEGTPNSDKKRRKKRKRDELEREYEERKYGVTPEDEEEKTAEGGESGGKKLVGEKRKKADDAADSMISNEGFDDESKLLRTVFVGNLPLKVKKKALLKEFSRFGEVESVRIRSVPIVDSKKTRKGAVMQKQINENGASFHAYIVFKTEQSAEASLAHNMALVGGNHIRVDRACPPHKKLKGQNDPLYDYKRTVFVGNLPFDVKDEELYQLFSSINNLGSSLEAVRVVRDPHISVGKGIAYVLFKTREAAIMVVQKGNLKLRDRELRISHARSDSTQSKRKNISHASEAKSPAKKLAMGSRTFADKDNRSNTKAAMSYQGLRATKSNFKRKIHSKSTGPEKMKPKSQKQEQPKERQQKRPAVAARKSKANVVKVGATKQAGTKRKLDSRTPESFHQKKKAKKF